MSKNKTYETGSRKSGPDRINNQWCLGYIANVRNKVHPNKHSMQGVWITSGQHVPISDGGNDYWLNGLTANYFNWEGDGQDHVDQGDTRIHRQWQRKYLNGSRTDERRISKTWNEALRVWKPADIGHGFNHEEEWYNGRKTGNVRGRELALEGNGNKYRYKEGLNPDPQSGASISDIEITQGGTYIIRDINAIGKIGWNKGGTDGVNVWNIRGHGQTFNFVVVGNNYAQEIPLENTEQLLTWFRIYGSNNKINIYFHNGGKLIARWGWNKNHVERVYNPNANDKLSNYPPYQLKDVKEVDRRFDSSWVQGWMYALTKDGGKDNPRLSDWRATYNTAGNTLNLINRPTAW